MNRLAQEVFQVTNIVPASRNAGTVNGTGVDAKDYGGVLATVLLGDIGATTTLDVKLQESDDNSTWADISGAAITQLAATDDNKAPSIDVRLKGRAAGTRKRYIRAVGVVAGSNAAVYAVLLTFYDVTTTPQTQTTAAVVVS